MRDITFETNSFDGVFCVWTTGHGSLEDSRRNVSEIYRVLKPKNFAQINITPINYYFSDNNEKKHTIKAFVVISIK